MGVFGLVFSFYWVVLLFGLFFVFFLSERGEFLINPKLKRGRKGHLYKQMFSLQLISNMCWVIY